MHPLQNTHAEQAFAGYCSKSRRLLPQKLGSSIAAPAPARLSKPARQAPCSRLRPSGRSCGPGGGSCPGAGRGGPGGGSSRGRRGTALAPQVACQCSSSRDAAQRGPQVSGRPPGIRASDLPRGVAVLRTREGKLAWGEGGALASW